MPKSDSATPLRTAALVCFNHRRFVREAVLSALSQTYPSIQVIVVDNGSTDGSRQELQALREEHDFELVLQENAGLVRALNLALSKAKGKYFAVLATDDVWERAKTAIQVAFFEKNPEVQLLSGQVRPIDADGRDVSVPLLVRPGEAKFADLMSIGCFVSGPTIMCLTQTLRDVGGYDESLRIEDFSLALKYTYEGRRVVVLPDVLTRYRRHETNWTLGSMDKDLAEIGQKYRSTPEYRAFYRLYFPTTFWQLVKDGKKRDAWHLLISEPVAWTWRNVGRGLVRMLIPYALVRAVRRLSNRFATSDVAGPGG